jgi:hypothetical protein
MSTHEDRNDYERDIALADKPVPPLTEIDRLEDILMRDAGHPSLPQTVVVRIKNHIRYLKLMSREFPSC